jgi:hypothetical protein
MIRYFIFALVLLAIMFQKIALTAIVDQAHNSKREAAPTRCWLQKGNAATNCLRIKRMIKRRHKPISDSEIITIAEYRCGQR